MARSTQRSNRKVSGGRYISNRTKRLYELAGYNSMTRIAPNEKRKVIRTQGGNSRQVLLTANQINIAVKGKVQKVEVTNVIENTANPNLVRRNILTKGAIVETKLGKARITSRPGQDAVINGILLDN